MDKTKLTPQTKELIDKMLWVLEKDLSERDKDDEEIDSILADIKFVQIVKDVEYYTDSDRVILNEIRKLYINELRQRYEADNVMKEIFGK